MKHSVVGEKSMSFAVRVVKLYRCLVRRRREEAMARQVQEAYSEENPKAGLVEEYLDRLLPEDWASKDSYDRRAWLESGSEGTVRRTTVCTAEIWTEALGGNPERMDRRELKEVSAIMAGIPEWRYMGNRKKLIHPYGRQRYYERRDET